VLARPVDGSLRRFHGHSTELILLQLMTGFCAHKLPF
jgi:hypothetical protein